MTEIASNHPIFSRVERDFAKLQLGSRRMDLHAFLIRTMIGPAWAAWERSPYLRDYRSLKRTEFDDETTIRSTQWKKLKDLLRHCQSTVPFYQKCWQSRGVNASDINNLDDFAQLPILTKTDIRTHLADLMSESYRGRKDLTSKMTSGSTGVSLEVRVDDRSMQFKRACTLRSDEWSGWRFGENMAMIWGNPEYRKRGWRGLLRNTLLERARYLDTLSMDESSMTRFAENLTQHPPRLIFGHAHSVFLFAEYVRRRGFGPIRPQGIITSAMILHEWQRQTIEDVFACKVTNRYGCEEVSLIACECERHKGLHVNTDGVYVELLRNGQPVGPDEPGSVVVTDLTNHAMPIIRYHIGDVAVWAGRTCCCGRSMPLLERIEGRESDYVITRSGELISGISLTENFAMLVPGVVQLQIIQEELDRFTFRIVRSDDFGLSSLEQIAQLVHLRFGNNTRYDCEYVVSIPQEPSGKYRFCISKVKNNITGDYINSTATDSIVP